MKIKTFGIVFSAAISAFISGCASEPKIAIMSNNVTGTSAENKLADAADSVSKSLQELAEIESATHPKLSLPSPSEPELIGMGQLASVDWSGPVGPFVKKIADSSNYKLHILGTQPAIPILISISAKNTPLADILRDAGFQCGNKANIVIYPASKIIELRYVSF